MNIAERMDELLALRLDRRDDRTIAMPKERGSKTGDEIDEDIPIGVDHIRADGLGPDDWIVRGAALSCPPRAPRRERRAFRLFEDIEIRPRALTGDGFPDAGERGACLAHGLIFSARAPLSNGLARR